MENHNEEQNDMLTDLTIREFLDKTAAGEPLPGGGSVSALAGALAAALAEMVARLTVGKKGYEEFSEQMAAVAEEASRLRQEMARSIDRDADAYGQVLQAFRLPKESPEQAQKRRAAVEEAFKQAARVPLAVARDALRIFDLAETAVKRGNRNAASDGIVAALMAKTALLGAAGNVRINLDAIRDQDFVRDFAGQVRDLLAEIGRRESRLRLMADI